ncbi:MAG TPA: hypothetical protein PL053_05000 [Deltaproteobacteria bacterium]|nr:hypothetical protein [Deltaproteobacteria bacterium]
MITLSDSKTGKTSRIRFLVRLLYASSMVALLLIVSYALLQTTVNLESKNSGTLIRRNSSAAELITLINTTFYQINNETDLLARDGERSIDNLLSLVSETDNRLDLLTSLLDSREKRESAVKAATTWKEYRKTLQSEILPAATRENIVKVTYLTTGIQTQRQYSIGRTLGVLQQQLHREAEEASNSTSVDNRFSLVLLAVATTALIGLAGACHMLLRSIKHMPIDQTPKHSGSTIDMTPTEETATSQVPATLGALAEQMGQYASRNSQLTKTPFMVCAAAAVGIPPAVRNHGDMEPILMRLSQAFANLKASSQMLTEEVAVLNEQNREKAVSALQISAGIDELAVNSDRGYQVAEDLQHVIQDLKQQICRDMNPSTSAYPSCQTESNRQHAAEDFEQLEHIRALTDRLENLLLHMRGSAQRYGNFAALAAESSLNKLDLSASLRNLGKEICQGCNEVGETLQLLKEYQPGALDELTLASIYTGEQSGFTKRP